MNSNDYQKAKQLFHETLELSPIERAAFFSANCPDKSLRQMVERLLSAHDEADEFIENPAVAYASDIFDEDWQNRRIGNYRIEGELGRGGMGAVFLASRDDDEFRQKVALKIVQSALNTKEIRQKFRQERQILADLDHSNIARLLDGGTTDDGLPFFVMEFVKGLPVTEYCAKHETPENERLEIFRQVCAAVEYAHRHLIIHRDIKPSNIIVMADGTPKLLDFGIAKLLSNDETQTQTITAFGAMTPEYASPEQIKGEKVSTATDIYSLGVVLAELIISPLSFVTSPSLNQKSISSKKQRTKNKEQRTNPDLQAILQTAMREEPELRYKSVEQFSEDIRRFLEGLPVSAHTDSFSYRASKFVRRNQIGVAAGASLAFAVVAGIFSTIRQSRKAEFQARIAAKERDKAQLEARKAEKINRFLQEILGAANPRTKGKDVKVAEVLDLAAQRIETDLVNQPETKADLQTTIGLTYLSLGLFEKSETHLRSALKIRLRLFKRESPEIAESLKNLGKLLQAKGGINEAEPLFYDALKIAEEINEDLLVAEILHNLGGLLLLKGAHDEAVEVHQQELAIRRAHLGNNHAEVAESLKDLAVVFGTAGKLDEAEKINREALEILRKIYQNDHPDIASAMTTLASAVEHKNPSEAEKLFREALAMRRKLLGNKHPDVAWTLYNYAYLLYNQKDFAQAIKLADEVLAMRGNILSDEHILINSSLQLRGLCLMEQSDLKAAEDFLRECFELRRKTMSAEHWLVASAKSILGECLAKQKRFDEAEKFLLESYETLKKVLGENHEQTRKAWRRIVKLMKARA